MSFIQDKFYHLMPVFVQNLMISAFGYQWKNRRFGGCFSEYLSEVREREYYTAEKWRNYQTEMLRKLLVHSFQHVRYYHEKYVSAGFKISDLSNITLSDLKFIPFLEKDDLRKFGANILLSDKLSKGIFTSSSGSTGTPTKIYLPDYFHQKWTALMESRVRNWAGVNQYSPRGMIGGRRILPDASYKEPYYRYNLFEQQTYFSAYHISLKTVENYLKGIIDNKVEYMTGYAMSNFFLARIIEEKGLNAPKLKAVITSSEKLTTEMRWTIEKVYNCKCYDSYSGSEYCGLISETPEGHLVVSPDAGIMEFLNEDGSYSAPGQTGEIISTGLLNYDQPLIRYRIGDLAKLSVDQSSIGNRQMKRIDEITGRIEDVVVSKDGRVMVRFHSLYVDIRGLKVGQLIQHDYDRFTLNLVVDQLSYCKPDAEELLLKRLESQIGNVQVTFQYHDNNIPDYNGKFKAVISELGKA